MKRHLIIWFLSSLFFLALTTFGVSGQGTVRGLVTGTDDNTPLVAATIVVKGTTTSTVSDYDAQYTLVLKAGTYTI